MINAVYFTCCQWLYVNWNIKASQPGLKLMIIIIIN